MPHSPAAAVLSSHAESRVYARLPTFALVCLMAACGADGTEGPAPGAIGTSDAAAFPAVDAAQAAAAPGMNTQTQDAGVTQPGNVVGDAATGGPVLIVPDAGPASDAGPIVIAIPTRAVACGGSDCTTTNNRTCCQAWSKGMGFSGTPTCTTNAACTADHTSFGDTNRAVVNDCDEPSDCSGGQICCFVRYGAPVTAELFSTDIVGPGASRLCMELSNCNAGMMSISGVAGIPVGLQACKSNADCKDGAQCTAETADSTTTGKGGAARPGVMVCK